VLQVRNPTLATGLAGHGPTDRELHVGARRRSRPSAWRAVAIIRSVSRLRQRAAQSRRPAAWASRRHSAVQPRLFSTCGTGTGTVHVHGCSLDGAPRAHASILPCRLCGPPWHICGAIRGYHRSGLLARRSGNRRDAAAAKKDSRRARRQRRADHDHQHRCETTQTPNRMTRSTQNARVRSMLVGPGYRGGPKSSETAGP